jgi:hypothetical protein
VFPHSPTEIIDRIARILGLIIFVVLLSPHLAVAQYAAQPTAGASPAAGGNSLNVNLLVSEEYNDNVLLSPNNPEDDYILRIVPGVIGQYTSSFWDWSVAYTYDYRNYAKKTRTDDTTHTLDLKNTNRLVKEFLFLDVTDRYFRVSKDIIHDFTQQSLFYNQSDTNTFTATPYVQWDITSQTSGTAGYQYRDVWYKDPTLTDKIDQSAFIDIGNQMSLNTVFTAGARYTDTSAVATAATFSALASAITNTNTKIHVDYQRIDIAIGPRHIIDSSGSQYWVIIGNTWLDARRADISISQLTWNVGLELHYKTHMISVNSALNYVDDPQRILRRIDHFAGSYSSTGDRYSFTARAGLYEYRDVTSKHLQDTRYNVAGSISYDIFANLRGTYALNIDRYEDNERKTFYMIYLNDFRLDHPLTSTSRLFLSYQRTHGYSPDKQYYNQNYDANRITLGYIKQF